MSKTVVVNDNRPGSVRAQVSVTGISAGVPEHISISLYQCPDNVVGTDGEPFDAEQYGWTPGQGRPEYQGYTGRKGEVHFGAVRPASYILTCDNHPATSPTYIEVESGCSKIVSVLLELNVRATVDQPCSATPNRDPACIVAGQPIVAKVTTDDFDNMWRDKQLMLWADPEWKKVDGRPGEFTKVAAPGANLFDFTLGLAPRGGGSLHAGGVARAAPGPGRAAARAGGGAGVGLVEGSPTPGGR